MRPSHACALGTTLLVLLFAPGCSDGYAPVSTQPTHVASDAGIPAPTPPPAMAELFGGCGRGVDGTFWCFSTPPRQDEALTGARDVSWGGGFGLGGVPTGFRCAVMPGGSIACDGSDYQGQLGIATQSVTSLCCYGGLLGSGGQYPCIDAPRTVPGLPIAQRVAAPGGPCMLSTAGAIECWGGVDAEQNLIPPRSIELPDKAVKIAGEGYALLANGQLASFSPSGCAAASCPAAVVQAFDSLVDVSSTYDHSCVVRADGAAFCWGLDSDGQLGDGHSVNATQSAAVRVTGSLQFASISTDLSLTCAVTRDGRVACWGATELSGDRLVPGLVPGVDHVRQVSACFQGAAGPIAYALRDDGSVLGIGDDEQGWVVQSVVP